MLNIRELFSIQYKSGVLEPSFAFILLVILPETSNQHLNNAFDISNFLF